MPLDQRARTGPGQGTLMPYLFLAPMLAGIALFYIGPIVFGLWTSFQADTTVMTGGKFVGLEHYGFSFAARSSMSRWSSRWCLRLQRGGDLCLRTAGGAAAAPALSRIVIRRERAARALGDAAGGRGGGLGLAARLSVRRGQLRAAPGGADHQVGGISHRPEHRALERRARAGVAALPAGDGDAPGGAQGDPARSL